MVEGFAQKRSFDRRYIIYGTVYVVQKDGEITYEDGAPVAFGALSYLALNATTVNFLARTGFTAASTSLLTGLFAIYEAGWWASYAIDGKKGTQNFNEFLTEPFDMHNKWWFTVETLGQEWWNRANPPPPKKNVPVVPFPEIDADVAARYYTYISPIVAADNLSPYVYDTIMTQGYNAFEEIGIGIPPDERRTAWKLAYSLGQVEWNESMMYGVN